MVTTRVSKFKKTHNTPTILVGCNDDLLIEILSRLPAKSILRFKSVSKHWLSLLSNPHFTFRFDKLSVSPGLFFNDEYIPFENQSTEPFRSLDFYPDPSGIKILQSCNGLLLCCSNCGSAPSRKYYVFNPTTKHFQIIPPLFDVYNLHANVISMGLAFHQTDCFHYKLVCIYRDPNPDRPSYKIQIYSSDTRKWRILNESFPLSIHLPFCKYVVYWNGSLHWASIENPFYLKLDVEHLQNLSLQNLQTSIPSYCIPLYFGESRGHLHLVEAAYYERPLHLNVYEMLIDHSGWFLKYQVDLHELVEAYPKIIYNYPNQSIPQFYQYRILDVVRGEKEEDTFLVIRIPQKIIRYNILDKSFKPISDFHGSIQHGEEAHRYIEMIGSF